jgi:hypothetical protein
MAIVMLWHAAIAFDLRMHSHILAKYPRLLPVVDGILELLYAICASPITALVVSLLLVPFVISGAIPVIVWGSVTMAWVLCTLSLARAAFMKQLSLISRFVLLVIVAAGLIGASRRYIRWSLLSYYANLPQQVSPTPAANVVVDPDQFGQRIDELLRKELRKIAPPPPRVSAPPSDTGKMLSTPQTPPAPSGDERIGKTLGITDKLRHVTENWEDVMRNLDHMKEDTIYYHQPPWGPEQYKVAEEMWKRFVVSRYNEDERKKLFALVDEANKDRNDLLTHIPTTSRTTADTKWKFLDGPNPFGSSCFDPQQCAPQLTELADYLGNLAKRAKAASQD